MPRYAPRPWYHPIGFMSSCPGGWPFLCGFLGMCAVYPFRYHYASYWERQRESPQEILRLKAVKYYSDIERQYIRTTLHNAVEHKHDMAAAHLGPKRQAASIQTGGSVDDDYLSQHSRDMTRAQRVAAEVKELKMKIANGATA